MLCDICGIHREVPPLSICLLKLPFPLDPEQLHHQPPSPLPAHDANGADPCVRSSCCKVTSQTRYPSSPWSQLQWADTVMIVALNRYCTQQTDGYETAASMDRY